MPYFELGDRRIPYRVVKGRSSRYTYLRFARDMTLEVVVPRRSKADPESEIRNRADWIRRQLDQIAESEDVLGADHLMIGGRKLRIVVEAGRKELLPDQDRGILLVGDDDRREVRELARRWFLTETSRYVVRRVRELSPLVGVRPRVVDVREMDKWGYCTREGRLSFSWQLAALPEKLREYVVLHELTHLKEFNHSRSFKAELSEVCPDFRSREEELGRILPYDRMRLG